jgi:hypothetical protein
MRVRRPLSARSRLLASAALLVLLLGAVSAVVQSAFTSTTAPESTFEAGSIELSGSVDRGSALFALQGMKPGPVESRCVKVTYASTGGLSSSVRLYGRAVGGLEDMLIVRIARGRFAGAAPPGGSCAGFVEDDQLFHAFLAQLPSSYAHGVRDPDPVWTDGESAVYRIDIELVDRDEAQGGTATHELVVEARNT